ncbi:MAG: putative DNA binding domain-containing protein [Bacteroidetes bacterium]|nr:putative DNA binding domain-containing protein [Bacteroidota bacterium]
MPENQDIEYKQSWQEDNLKTICAFANSQGGTLIIGKDDKGALVDVVDYKKLMDDIPNKIKNHLGITVKAVLREEKNIHYIEIVVLPYSVAISLRCRYYIRTGSTTSELTGASLNDFLLKKSGKTWDDLIEDRASLDDIDESSITTFLEAAKKAGRLPDTSGLTKIELLQKLRLADGEKLKRAAIILFGKDPGKFYPNVSVKIGRFGKDDSDLKYQEVEEGNLIKLLQEVLQQLNRKFFTSPIEFEGLQRIEKGEYPVAAVREMLLNALVHKTYFGSTIQIRMYDDKFSIWNEGTLPEGLTFESLRRQHPSRPRNPIIADVCFKGGYIESWGSGTLRIINSCKEASLPEPEMKESDGGILVTLFKDNFSEEQLKKLGLNERQIIAVSYLKQNTSIRNSMYQEIANTSERTALRDLEQLVELNIVEKLGEKKAAVYRLKRG